MDAGNTLTRARKDSVDEVLRAPHNLDSARLAMQRFAYREAQGLGDSLTDAERRIRQGKFADALWHLGTDPLKHTEENAARMAQESSILRAIGQVAATAYGGYGGAAAFAAWYTYRTTKDPELALRVGMITGATSFAFSEVGKIPSNTVNPVTRETVMSVPAVTRKAVVAGAIGGMAVAASGGDKKALRDGFLYSGGTILVQDIYENVTSHRLDARASNKPAYAMSSFPGEPGAPPAEAYFRDQNGRILIDQNGNPLIDVRKTAPRAQHVGHQSSRFGITSERGAPMTAISKIPAMNAMGLFHDQCAAYFDMNALTSVGTIPPAIVFTYIGTGTQTYDLIQKTAARKEKEALRSIASPTIQRDDQASSSAHPNALSAGRSSLSDHYISEAAAVIRNLDFEPGGLSSRSANSRSRAWKPGSPHPTNKHVVAAKEEDSWEVEPGYRWVDPDDSQDLSRTLGIRFRSSRA